MGVSGHFLICFSRVQLERYESGLISPSPVVLMHQHLIFCFDLCRLPLVPACLESPSRCERAQGLLSTLVLCMNREGGFMGAFALPEALIIAQWLPQWSNYAIRCTLHPFCPGPKLWSYTHTWAGTHSDVCSHTHTEKKPVQSHWKPVTALVLLILHPLPPTCVVSWELNMEFCKPQRDYIF